MRKTLPKFTVFIFVLAIIITASFAIYSRKTINPDQYQPGSWPEADIAVNQAQHFFLTQKSKGVDFAEGPCLSNDLMGGWVADIVHSPREPVDDLAQNQCPAILEGRAEHFVELDLNGNVTRVR